VGPSEKKAAAAERLALGNRNQALRERADRFGSHLGRFYPAEPDEIIDEIPQKRATFPLKSVEFFAFFPVTHRLFFFL